MALFLAAFVADAAPRIPDRNERRVFTCFIGALCRATVSMGVAVKAVRHDYRSIQPVSPDLLGATRLRLEATAGPSCAMARKARPYIFPRSERPRCCETCLSWSPAKIIEHEGAVWVPEIAALDHGVQKTLNLQ